MKSLKQKTISGIAWNSGGKISNQVLQFILSVILMRLLQPSDYGLIAMAMVLIGFAGIFNEFGFSSALVQHQNITEEHKSSIFWLNLIVGITLTLLFFSLAETFASLYENDNLVNIIKYLSFSFIINSVSIVPGTLLQKEMNYAAINKIDVTIVIISGLIGVYLAFNGWDVMSLVVQYLASQLLKIPLLFIASHWYPKFLYSKDSVRELFSYSAYLTGFNFVNYCARRSDDLLVGKFMGADSLGIYSRAYSLMLLPINQVINIISNVMFPALSSIQEDKERVKRIFLKTIQFIAFITFPMMIGLIAAADNFIIGVFGDKWSEVIPVIRILAFVGVAQTIANPTGWIYTSQGKTNWMFWWGVFGSGSIIAAIVIGVILGSIYTVAVAYLVINMLLAYPVVAIPGKLINMKYREVIKTVLPTLIVSILIAIFVYFLGIYLPDYYSYKIKLIIQVVSGFILYILTMWFFEVDSFENLRKFLIEQYHFYRKKATIDK